MISLSVLPTPANTILSFGKPASTDARTSPPLTQSAPKLASRIILELKDKLKGQAFADDSGTISAEELTTSTPSGKKKDAEDALIVLGYSKSEVAAVLRTIDTNTLEVDEIIRQALKKLMR